MKKIRVLGNIKLHVNSKRSRYNYDATIMTIFITLFLVLVGSYFFIGLMFGCLFRGIVDGYKYIGYKTLVKSKIKVDDVTFKHCLKAGMMWPLKIMK